MSTSGAAFIAGAYEHPMRVIPDKSLAQVHAEVALGALRDAGLSISDVDGYYSASAHGLGPISQAEYLGLTNLRHLDSTQTGGSSPLIHVAHAAEAILAGNCSVALITLAGLPRQGIGMASMPTAPEFGFEDPYGLAAPSVYALAARRHMHEFGTTSEQLAEIKVAASQHAQHNEYAIRREVVTVEEVVNSRMVCDPLHLLDCCQITDGGGALVVVSEEVARSLDRHCIRVLGHGEAPKHLTDGRIDLTFTGAAYSGPVAFETAGVTTADIDYVSIYDSFTITVLETIEDLGFCEKGEGGKFVTGGTLQAPLGKLPFNTDGGGLCNNHPGNMGGVTKAIEAVRQLRGEAHPEVQVPDCDVALADGTGGLLTRMGSATLILGRDDA